MGHGIDLRLGTLILTGILASLSAFASPPVPPTPRTTISIPVPAATPSPQASPLNYGSQSAPQTVLSGRQIRKIEIRGLARTREKVILRELTLQPGALFNPESWQQSIQEVKNLQIVRVLGHEVVEVGETQVDLVLTLEDRWTLILLSDLAKGADIWVWALGLDDANFLGTYQELGFQVDSYGGRISAAAWYRDPRFLYDQTGRRIRFGADVAALRRNRNLWTQDLTLNGAFSLDRFRAAAFGELQWNRELATGFMIDFQLDEVHDRALSVTQKNANQAAGGGPPANAANSGANPILKAWQMWGRLHYDDFLVRGQVLKLTLEQGIGLPYTRLGLDSRIFFLLPFSSNLGFRFLAVTSQTTAVQHLFSLGPIENLRGHFDSMYMGNHLIQFNSEYRIPSIMNSWFVLQHVALVDFAWVWGFRRPGATLGVGIRLSSPRLLGLLVRLDAVLPLDSRLSPEITFGTQQFF